MIPLLSSQTPGVLCPQPQGHSNEPIVGSGCAEEVLVDGMEGVQFSFHISINISTGPQATPEELTI